MGVVGCGLMGSGIAEVCARAGYTTIVREINDELLARGRAAHRKVDGHGRRARQARRPPSATRRWSGSAGTTRLEDFGACDLVIEAATENPEIKKRTFAELDQICPPHAILASNTSSIPIIQMATATRRPDKVLGMHFMNPVPVMRADRVRAHADHVRRNARDRPSVSARAWANASSSARTAAGFIVNFLLIPYLPKRSACSSRASPRKKTSTSGMMLGTSYPMGPFTLLDYVGLDTTLFIADILFDEFKDPRFAAPTLLRQMVAAGYLGRKTGRGFYNYCGR